MKLVRNLLTAIFMLAIPLAANAQESETIPTGLLPNLTVPTLGGTQFWSDEFVFRDWRIQRNVITGHCRLLDGDEYRHAWGTFEGCLARFETIRQEREFPPITGKVVITLHGLMAWRGMMDRTCDHLAEHGFTPINVSYASTRRSLDDHAHALAGIIGRLDQADEIHFVCHSMGNLVVRRYLALAAEEPGGIDPRIKRMVMVGPPNQGASLARHFRELELYGLLLGPSAELLADDAESIGSLLATPTFPFAIIAGTNGINPLLEAHNDFMVTVDETKLAGASDFLELPLLHAQLMNDPRCQHCVLHFLQQGRLQADAQRQPLTR